MSRFFNNFSLGAQFRRRDPEGKKDIEKGPDVLTEEHEHGSSQDELDDTELDLEEENEEDEVIEDHDEDHDEVMEDHDEELEHHEELEQEDTTNDRSFHRRRSSTASLSSQQLQSTFIIVQGLHQNGFSS
ncbi:hypothetical protein BT96DRAFT_1001013 [Gymnopus androsaceus JB14]|uniref:Uncharacterized protein n=1 Tax=Gymnopus androsaceus JB14 TaxID=1447944 RepID=A0A6A4H2W6_9AGAR|nr:hypothetical protein BT96DRAFT_1001013 [Gymnopus androsaceus JB14]